jgi:hypothetical protein
LGGGIDQDQLDALFTAALEAGIARIEKDGTFFPLLFELRVTGSIQNVAVLESGPIDGRQTVLDRFAEVLRSRIAEGLVAAAAIVVHRHAEDMVEVQLRAANYSANVFAPYGLATSGFLARKRQLSLGAFVVRPARNEVF